MRKTEEKFITKLSKLIVFVLFALSLTACSEISSLASGTGTIIFGSGSIENGIEEEKDIFGLSENILMETTLNNPFETSEVRFSLLKIEGESETMYDEWVATVDPAWEWFVYELHLPELQGELEEGDYKLRMFKNDSELISEGSFSIQ